MCILFSIIWRWSKIPANKKKCVIYFTQRLPGKPRDVTPTLECVGSEFEPSRRTKKNCMCGKRRENIYRYIASKKFSRAGEKKKSGRVFHETSSVRFAVGRRKCWIFGSIDKYVSGKNPSRYSKKPLRDHELCTTEQYEITHCIHLTKEKSGVLPGCYCRLSRIPPSYRFRVGTCALGADPLPRLGGRQAMVRWPSCLGAGTVIGLHLRNFPNHREKKRSRTTLVVSFTTCTSCRLTEQVRCQCCFCLVSLSNWRLSHITSPWL